jgi:hypothetical protein
MTRAVPRGHKKRAHPIWRRLPVQIVEPVISTYLRGETQMKKNWDIIREILLRLESASTPNTYLNANEILQYPVQEVAYNMRLLDQAGYIKANIRDTNSGNGEIGSALAIHLTNTGHELLDTIRTESVWSKITDTFKLKGIDMTFDLVISVGKEIMENILR